MEASVRKLGPATSEDSAAAGTIHSPSKRYLRLRLDNCPSTAELSRQAAVAAVAPSGDAYGHAEEVSGCGPTAHGDLAAGVAGDDAQRMIGGGAYAAEVGTSALPADPWLNLSLVADGERTASTIQQAVKNMPTISNESQAAHGVGRKLADSVTADEQRTCVNRFSLVSCASTMGSTAAAAGSGMDLIVDGVLFASDFSAIRVSPLALEDGGDQHTIALMHPM